MGFFHFLEIVTGWLDLLSVKRSQYSLVGTFHDRRSRLLKTGFLMQVAENTKEIPGSALLMRIGVAAISHMHNGSEVVGRSH
jgi:hypothetical protein